MHKEELTDICNKILIGCPDSNLRLSAYAMLGKLLWADGKSDDALSLYKEKMSSWYDTFEQKSEQLFAKDTPEFLYWVRKNMYELIAFAADKLSKSVFFDPDISYGDKVRKIESYGDKGMEIYQETDEDFFLLFSSSIIGRLANDLKYRGGAEEDVKRIKAKTAEIRAVVSERAEHNGILKEVIIHH